jgi:hypothetical protein
MPPAGDVFGLDGIFLTKSNPVVVSIIGINSTSSGAGIAVTSGVLNATAGIATLTLSRAAGLSTTPFYTGAKIAVSGLANASGTAFTGYNGTFNVTGFAGTTTVSYATTGYVGPVTAGITTTGLVILVTDTAVTNTTWSSAQTHGWFGGGDSGAGFSISTVDRIDFSNDTGTANIRGFLSSAILAGRRQFAATGNSNYGWFSGGGPGAVSTVDRIDFSNDSSTASIRGSLSSARYFLAATGNSNYGWFGGGINPSPFTIFSTVDRIDFSNDSSTASPRSPLSLARHGLAATGNSNYGWFGGGGTPTLVSTVDRIDFSNDSSTASPRGPLSLARGQLAATGNSNYGWFGGGTGPAISSTVQRIDFSNDSSFPTVRGPLSLARVRLAATGNSNYGWFSGGASGSPIASVSTVERIDFSNDLATASPRGPLSSAKYNTAATSGQARSSSTRLQKAGNYGWFGGGTPSPAPPPFPLSITTIERIDFSNDLSAISPRGGFLTGRRQHAATGNSNYGWFGGGVITLSNFPIFSSVERIDFSNDNATASVRGPLSSERWLIAATGNSNYGWFCSASPLPSAPVDRINFANDNATALVRGLLNISAVPNSSKEQLAATGNSNYGWFGGGTSPGGNIETISRVDRIDFSNDSATASPRGPLSEARYNLAATGNSNYGWFGGGQPGPSARVDRIDFSNDSATASIRGSLSSPTDGLTATGNSNYGWFGGGFSTARVGRIDFSNDLATATARGPLSAARAYIAATSNTPT